MEKWKEILLEKAKKYEGLSMEQLNDREAQIMGEFFSEVIPVLALNNVPFEEVIEFLTQNLHKEVENESLSKEELLNKINESLDNGDKEMFLHYSSLYKERVH